ncbi:hypothetical protein Ddye_004104 [Dipteronia dyeriana]|uniref:Dirigent protein n=1 Tax=Dipteronia dyeriana TaxID=168575 RepID=A0AAE0CW02_9ROSI|nr:hypothetical protein Ddye_004104 [Dipteronia dyeriana]
MDWSLRLSFSVFLILAAAIDGARADAMVTGTVFCDQCKDGQRSLFDYPISGIKVTITCTDIDGQTRMSREVTTNWFGSYSMSFDGSPNLSNCQAQASGSSDATTGCAAAAGPAQILKLTFNWFGTEIYYVDSLLTQPDHPMSFCPKSATPVSPPSTPVDPPPTPVTPTDPIFPPSTPVDEVDNSVLDEVFHLEGFDHNDEATSEASRYIPLSGYIQFLNPSGLKGKRLGIYLEGLVVSPVRTLADVIEFNNKFEKSQMTEKYGQQGLLDAQETDGINAEVKEALLNLENLSRDGLEKLMEQKLDVQLVDTLESMSLLAGQSELMLVTYFDFGFTTGKFSGSLINMLSRNPVREVECEFAVVGGQGKLRMARGFAKLKCIFYNESIPLWSFDHNDEATREASKYIPLGGYIQFLKPSGLKGKRLGIVRDPFFTSIKEPEIIRAFEHHFRTLRQQGAVLVDNLKIVSIDAIMNPFVSGEGKAMDADLKLDLNNYLEGLVVSPVRSLADVIEFNNKFTKLEMTEEYGQQGLLDAQKTDGINAEVKEALLNLAKLSRNGLEKLMREQKLDAVVTHGVDFSTVLAIGGYPGINVPAGYDSNGVPFGICFGGLKGTEPKLIEIAYGFEQATKIRKPPPPIKH